MNVFNPVDSFSFMADRFGPLVALLAFLAFLYTVLARYGRAVMWGLLVLLATQVWYPPVYVASRSLRWWIVGVLVVRGVMQLGSGGPRLPSWALPRTLIGGLSALAVASALWARSGTSQTAFLMAASLAVGMLLVFVVLWSLQDRVDLVGQFPRAALVLAFLVYGTGFLVAALALVFDSYAYLDAVGWYGRYSGVFINPNMAGLLGATLFPIVIAAPRTFLGHSVWMRWPAIVFLAVTIFMSGSRSALIGSALAVILLLLYRNKVGSIFAIAAVSTGIWIMLTVAPIQNVDESVFGHISRTKHINTLSGRLELWEMGWNAAKDSPIVGLGWGASRALGMEFDLDTVLQTGGLTFASNLHSTHVQLLVDLGVLGLAMFWAFSICVLVSGLRVLRAPKSPHNELVVLIFASFVGMLADTFVHGGVFSIGSPSALIFWTFASLVLKQADRVRALSAGPPQNRYPGASSTSPRGGWQAPPRGGPHVPGTHRGPPRLGASAG